MVYSGTRACCSDLAGKAFDLINYEATCKLYPCLSLRLLMRLSNLRYGRAKLAEQVHQNHCMQVACAGLQLPIPAPKQSDPSVPLMPIPLHLREWPLTKWTHMSRYRSIASQRSHQRAHNIYVMELSRLDCASSVSAQGGITLKNLFQSQTKSPFIAPCKKPRHCLLCIIMLAMMLAHANNHITHVRL